LVPGFDFLRLLDFEISLKWLISLISDKGFFQFFGKEQTLLIADKLQAV
jgi:hypothetical protein